MKISSRFSVAVHIIALIYMSRNEVVTSEYLAGSVNTNPVVIRRILGMLKKAGIVSTKRGPNGSFLIKDIQEITLLEVYKAVDSVSDGMLFQMHENPNPKCIVGANIQSVIEIIMLSAQDAMEAVLASVNMEQIVNNIGENNHNK